MPPIPLPTMNTYPFLFASSNVEASCVLLAASVAMAQLRERALGNRRGAIILPSRLTLTKFGPTGKDVIERTVGFEYE